jgi:zinc protease
MIPTHPFLRTCIWLAPLCLTVGMPSAPANGAPHSLDSLETAAARLKRLTLPNGMTVLLLSDHSAPVVSVQIWVGTGSIHEDNYLGAGLSHFVEHMIFKGTPKRPIGAISRAINEAGGKINAYTSLDRTVFYTDLPSRHWELGLDVLLDALQHPDFPADECTREQKVILREMAMGNDDPDRLHTQLLWSLAYARHPFRFPVIGYPEIFKSIQREDLIAFFKRHYTPDNMLIMVAGDIPEAAVEEKIRELTRDFDRQARAPILLPQEPPQIAPRVLRQTGPYQIGRIHLAYHTVALTHPDAPALDLLAAVVGRGRSSRLNHVIKEEQRLVHSIDGWSFTPADPGLFGVSATFDPSKEDEVIRAIEAQIAEWIESPFPVAELDKARNLLLTGEIANLQTASGQAGKFATGEFYARDPAFSIRYLQQLQILTPRDLQAVARKYLTLENRSIAILTPQTATPQTAPTQDVVIPEIQRLELKSGATLLVRPDSRLPLVYVSAVCRGGLLAENDSNSGISRLMAELLTCGTAHHSQAEIARQIESMGSELSSFSGQNSFGLQGYCRQENLPAFLALFSECLLQPAFDATEVDKQIQIQLAAISEQLEQPMALAQQNLLESLFPAHPYRWNVLGRPETVKTLTPDALRAHHHRLVVSGNLAVSIFGDIQPVPARRAAEKVFKAIPRGPYPAREYSAVAPVLPNRKIRLEPKEQAILLIGYPGIDVKDSRRDALQILETALSGMSSPLFEEIREKRGLAYYTGAAFRPGTDPGHLSFYAGTRADALDEVEHLINDQINRIVREGLTPAEIDRARNQIVAAWEMSLQDNLGLALSSGLNELYGLGFNYDFSIRQRLESMTPDSVRAAAASLLKPERQAVSIVRPEAPASTPKGKNP